MMTPALTRADVEAIRSTPQPLRATLGDPAWKETQKRINALNCVLSGAPISTASKRFGPDRRTISRMLSQALAFDPSGARWGYRACVPHSRVSPATAKTSVVPCTGHAFAMDAVLRAEPYLGRLIEGFKGELPSRTQRSPSFNRLFNAFRRYLIGQGHQDRYPLNTSDRGRRALIQYIRRARKVQIDYALSESLESPSTTRIEHIVSILPGDRFEFDEHSIDINGWIAIPDENGSYRIVRVRHFWLLAMIDVGSGAIVAWALVVGEKYNRFDVLRTFSNSLIPWERRELLTSEMKYSGSAWMPSCNHLDGEVASAAMVGMDNDSSHLAIMSQDNLLEIYKGILHLGRAGMGEGRPYIEAFFRRAENGLFRLMAGGFSPETDVNERTTTSTADPRKNPIVVEMLEDLIDTYVTLHNAVSRSELEKNSPKTIWEEHQRTGDWILYRPSSLATGRSLTVQRFSVCIRGKGGTPPLVYRDYARYRAPALACARHLIGRSFEASYEDWRDIRCMTLWNEDGTVLMRLYALTPYAAVPHSLPVRKMAAAWARKHEGRETADIHIEDNVQAYQQAVRQIISRTASKSNSTPKGRNVVDPENPAPLAGLLRPGQKLRLR